MKVVWIVPGFSRDERDWCIPALLDLARVLAQHCELHIIALRYPYRRDRYSVYGATVHAIGGGHRGARFTPGIWREALNLINLLQADVLHAFWAYEPGLIAARAAVRMPIIISLAGGELIDLPKIKYGLARHIHLRLVLRWSLRRAEVVTAGSKYLIEIARKFLGSDRIEFAPLGVDINLFNLAKVSKPSQGYVLNVGSLEPIKDQAMLLHAFRRVHDQLPYTRLVVAGEGNLRGRLERLAAELHVSDCVEFHGDVAHHDLPKLYHSAAAFAQSSVHEAQGMAVLEAAACGLPIVGTRVGVLSDLAPGAAIATSPGDVDGLAAALIEVLTQPDRAGQLGQAARTAAQQAYNLDRSAQRFISIYQSLASRP